jgi:hypothetical protein
MMKTLRQQDTLSGNAAFPNYLRLDSSNESREKVLSIAISAYTAGETCCRPVPVRAVY